MTQEKPGPKSRPSLGATIGVGVIAGAAVGYLVGSGIDDVLRLGPHINLPIEYVKGIPAGLGALAWSGLGILQYFNRDEHEGRLIIHIVEGAKPVKPTFQSQSDLEGLAHVVEGLTCGIKNEALARDAYSRIEQRLSKKPFDRLERAYSSNKNSFLANQFRVFDPFNYEGREIDPRATLDSFFETGDRVYTLAVEGLSNAAERAVTGKGLSRKQQKAWSGKFREVLGQEIELAQDAALWLTYLSKREGIVGSKVRDQLAQLGIINPDYLARDVEVLGNNVLQIYDRLVTKQQSG